MALALAFTLTACSLADFAYDLAPRVALRHVDDYLQLNNRQEVKALELFRARHAMHARDELPRYYRFLSETEEAISDGIDTADVNAVFDGVRRLYRLGVERTVPAAAEILAGLDKDQLDALQNRLREDVEEDRKRIDEDHDARRRRKTLEEIEEWIGGLDESQQRMVIRNLEDMVETRPLWLAWRMSRNEKLVELLRDQPEREAIEVFLMDYWIHNTGMPSQLHDGMQANRDRYSALIVALDESLQDGQRRTALEKLAEYREMIVDMLPDEIRVAVLEGNFEFPDRQMLQ